jgi:hypothetical protein
MAHPLDQYWKDGGFMSADDFRDQSVPGATAGVDPVTMQPYIDEANEAAMNRVAGEVGSDTQANQLATKEMTEAEKAAEEERKARIDLSKAKLAEQKAALDRADKEAGLGMRPEPEVDMQAPIEDGYEFSEEEAATHAGAPFRGADPDVFEEEKASAIAAKEQQLGRPLTPEEQMATGLEMGQTGRAMLGGVNAKIAQEEADATYNFQADRANAAKQEIEREELQRAKAEKRFAEIDSQIQRVVEEDTKKPSPSALNLLGVFLGGLIAPMQGGRNVALEAVERQMEREIRVDQENRAKRMQGLRTRKGILTDELAEQSRQDVAADLKRAQWHNAMYKEAIAFSQKTNLPAKQKAEALAFAGDQRFKKGEAMQRAALSVRKQEEVERKNRQAAAMKRSGGVRRGGGGTEEGAVKDADIAAGNLFYNPLQPSKPMTGTEVDQDKDTRKRAVKGGIVLKVGDTTYRGFLADDEQDKREVKKAIKGFRDIRQPIQRISALLDDESGNIGDMTWSAFSASIEGQLSKAEFTRLKVAIKNLWELGAIQKPDEVLIDGALGGDPTSVWNTVGQGLSRSDMLSVLKNLQSGTSEQTHNFLLDRADLIGDEDVQLSFKTGKVGGDINQWKESQRAATPDELIGNIGRIVDRAEAIAGGAPGTEDLQQASDKDIRNAVSDFGKMVEAGKFTSAGVEAGGDVVTGAHMAEYKRLRNMAPPKLRDKMDVGLDKILDVYPDEEDKMSRRAAEMMALKGKPYAYLNQEKIYSKYQKHLAQLRRAKRNAEMRRQEQYHRFDINPQ